MGFVRWDDGASNQRACFPQSGTQLSSSLAGLQAEKEALLRSVREQEAELNSLRQQSHFQHSSLEQERQRSSMELGSLQAQLQQQVPATVRPRGRGDASDGSVNRRLSPQAHRETELAQKLQNEQFALLQCAVVEAEGIILDAVAKLDDPIHIRCVSSPGKDAPHTHSRSHETES